MTGRRWIASVAVILVVGVGGFAVGRATDSSDADRPPDAERPADPAATASASDACRNAVIAAMGAVDGLEQPLLRASAVAEGSTDGAATVSSGLAEARSRLGDVRAQLRSVTSRCTTD